MLRPTDPIRTDTHEPPGPVAGQLRRSGAFLLPTWCAATWCGAPSWLDILFIWRAIVESRVYIGPVDESSLLYQNGLTIFDLSILVLSMCFACSGPAPDLDSGVEASATAPSPRPRHRGPWALGPLGTWAPAQVSPSKRSAGRVWHPPARHWVMRARHKRQKLPG